MVAHRSGKEVVILSAFHDYRTGRRASIQAVADALVRLGYPVSFVSTRFSLLSRIAGDSRNFLWSRANRPEIVNGVQCYLWRTAIHPFNSRRRFVKLGTRALFPLYSMLPNRFFDDLLRRADYIIVESSAAIFLRRIRRLNPTGKIIYYAADRLDTVGAHPYVIRELEANGRLIDHCSVRSRRMAADFDWAGGRVHLAEFGIHRPDFANIGPSPYRGKLNAVSVGSMLFDPGFFTAVAPHFPEVEFHVIGCGMTFKAPSNVRIHPEMPFKETLPFLKHATFGVAPYRPAPGADYLAESSLKLAQYEFLGLPAVCPAFAAGQNPNRFGSVPGDLASMKQAVEAALAQAGRVEPRSFLSWDEVAQRVLEPSLYPDTALPPAESRWTRN